MEKVKASGECDPICLEAARGTMRLVCIAPVATSSER